MGWSFHRSMNIGPFRVNAGKQGIGFSLGTGPFRAGVAPTGRTYASANVPGTGLRYQQTLSKGQVQQPTGLGWIAAAGMLLAKFMKG